jgi:uncharacterized protein
MGWEQIVILVLLPLACLAGVMLTVLTLPGNWLIVLAATGVAAWQPGVIGWWTVVALVMLAALGEGLEFIASKQGAIGALIGTLVGAIAGLPVLPPIGPIVGGALGAAAGTIIAERGVQKRSWGESARAGTGAAIGRLVATLAKALIAIVMALVACLAAVV